MEPEPKPKFKRQEYIDILLEKGAILPCHRCGNKKFSIIDGFSRFDLSDAQGENLLAGQGIPLVIAVCNNCGAVTPHAALVLKPNVKTEGGQDGQ